MKNLFSNINIKGTVVLGVLTSIICVNLIQPIFDIAKNFSGNIFTSLVDYYYFRAATVNSNDLPQLGSFYIVAASISIVIYIMFEKIKNYTKDIQNINKRDKQTKQLKEIDELSLIDEIKDIENQKMKIEEELKILSDKPVDSIKVIKKRKILSIVGFIFYIIYFAFVIIFSYFPNVPKNVFDNTIIKITPYVETAEIDMLKSNWVSMKTKSDYDTINDKIKSIINENNLN